LEFAKRDDSCGKKRMKEGKEGFVCADHSRSLNGKGAMFTNHNKMTFIFSHLISCSLANPQDKK
jgi:hypothetical protein